MNPECKWGPGKSHGNFMACQTQTVIIVNEMVIITINSITFIIIDFLDGKILQE